MSEPLLTKRLHISGLTPSVTEGDLERRLSSFGRVKAMDGFGACDALGDPRKFAFVTMEIGAKQLAKCLNVLSGSTWKGSKIRLGEAKPDFDERLAQFNAQPPRLARPKRMRPYNYGRASSTLPLAPLSATAAASTPGWIVTPSGRVVRPMRMRPERPLVPMRSETGASSGRGVNNKAKKKRVKPPPIRARRCLIDPTKWDSVYLKGVFLDAVPIPPTAPKDVLETFGRATHDMVEGEVEESDSDDSDALSSGSRQKVTHSYLPSPQQSEKSLVSTSSRPHGASESIDIRGEANAALAMLDEMFGNKEDWDGPESVDEMQDLEVNEERVMGVDGEDDIEIVSRDLGQGRRSAINKDKSEVGEEEVHDRDTEMGDIKPLAKQTAEHAPPTSLKSLFAPREEVSFSLLDHLDLDLDLELETNILGINAPVGSSQDNNSLSQPIPSDVVQVPTTTLNNKAHSRVTLDPSLPLLFPLPDLLPHPCTPSPKGATTTHRSTQGCFLFPSVTQVRNLRHLPTSTTFTRSPQDTSESIRERWEKDKSGLTREWKKAWREARGSRRGGRGAGGDGY